MLFFSEMSKRTEKVASTLHHELAPLLLKHFNSSKFGLITINRVEVMDDLKEARVYCVVQKCQQEFMREIKKKAWKISRDLSPRLVAKQMPRLRFLYSNDDDSINRVLNILDSLK